MSLKVVMFVQGPPVSDARVMKVAYALSEDGFDVTIIALGKKSEQDALVKINSNLRVEHVFLTSRSLPKIASLLIVKYLELCLRVLTKSWTINADVYHAYNLSSLPVMWFVSKIRSSLLVFDSSELYFDRPFIKLPWLWRLIQSWLLRRTDLVFAANEVRARIMHDEYGAPTLPTVIHNYANYHDVDKSSVLKEFVIGRGRHWTHILLHQGNIRPNRAPKEIIQALKYISHDAGVVFLGSIDEDYRNYLLQLAMSENVEDRVLFHPAVSLEVLPNYTASATVGLVFYLNTSRNNYYCAPNKLYAYLMAGIPAVGSAFPGLREDIEGNRVGVVADPQDPESLAGAINLLLKNQDTRHAMGLRAKKLSKEQWNWGKERIKLQKAYRHMVETGNRDNPRRVRQGQ